MADNGGNAFLGFILGGLAVIVGLMGFLIYGGALPDRTSVTKAELPEAQTQTK